MDKNLIDLRKLIKSFDFKNESNSSIIKKFNYDEQLFVYLIKYILVYSSFEVYLGKEIPSSLNYYKNKFTDNHLHNRCVFIKDFKTDGFIRLGIDSGLRIWLDRWKGIHTYVCIHINKKNNDVKVCFDKTTNSVERTIISTIEDGLKKNLKKILKYIISARTLLYLCTKYVDINKEQFQDYELKSLNKDIRKLLEIEN